MSHIRLEWVDPPVPQPRWNCWKHTVRVALTISYAWNPYRTSEIVWILHTLTVPQTFYILDHTGHYLSIPFYPNEPILAPCSWHSFSTSWLIYLSNCSWRVHASLSSDCFFFSRFLFLLFKCMRWEVKINYRGRKSAPKGSLRANRVDCGGFMGCWFGWIQCAFCKIFFCFLVNFIKLVHTCSNYIKLAFFLILVSHDFIAG